MASKRSKFRMTLSYLQICSSKQASALAPQPKTLVFSPYNLKSLELSYPNLPEPPPSTPTDFSGIWDVPCNVVMANTEVHNCRVDAKTHSSIYDPCGKGGFDTCGKGRSEIILEPTLPIPIKKRNSRGVHYEASRFKKEYDNKEICSSSEETTWFSVESNEEIDNLGSSSLPSSKKSNEKEICRKPISSLKSKGSYSSRKSGLEHLIPCIENGKVVESYAVLKRSKSPTEDFKKSMMEMIVEKQMFEVEDLEQLLSCFLSLNSRKHHAAIVSAFTEVWTDLFFQPNRALEKFQVI